MRLAFFLETNNLLSARQYGFQKSISTVDALRSVWEYIVESKLRGIYTCLLKIDIKSAFNSVSRTDILRFLEKLRLEQYLLGFIDDYVWYPSIIFHEGENFYNVGIPKGS